LTAQKPRSDSTANFKTPDTQKGKSTTITVNVSSQKTPQVQAKSAKQTITSTKAPTIISTSTANNQIRKVINLEEGSRRETILQSPVPRMHVVDLSTV
jgi:hypothetical protein